MKMLNRNAVIIKGKQPYKDWVAGMNSSSFDYDGSETEFPVYLLPEAKDDADFQRILKKHFKTIFENELFGWYTDESAWPQKRDFKTFQEWFEVEYASEVMDLSGATLKVEEF